ncbi:acyl-CoA thioesterase [Mesorhizobium sp. M7A.F.Ca.US.006.01.1.1]|uniref:acyl-CoA thioesterase n=1 Tax=Mesorhizobium sp. M7A.F.Ca.US.006.01.1.1 TaxID=2496707 RepID=UPI000FCA59F1|nr:acyl-CoA thioesterase [Mesorhizobium sp. M7A.F.Ca.US.006.01.1.1]RUZ72792.1 acyl-CoA thioesterase [Mesorhizobium sp. M7A.F.Ca.US.006.01.1.1]
MNDAQEFVRSALPFIVRRRVRWSDCDPAGVAYAGRYVDYMLDAVMEFFRRTGYGPEGTAADNVGLPCKHLGMTFFSPVRGGAEIDLAVYVALIKHHTVDLVVQCAQANGTPVFTGDFSPICIRLDAREKVAIPAGLHTILSSHSSTQERIA